MAIVIRMNRHSRHIPTEQEVRFAEQLAARLRHLRERTGYTQEQVAQRAGISPNAYQHYESAQSGRGAPMNPRLFTIFSLANAYDVTPAELLDIDHDIFGEDEDEDDDGRWLGEGGLWV